MANQTSMPISLGFCCLTCRYWSIPPRGELTAECSRQGRRVGPCHLCPEHRPAGGGKAQERYSWYLDQVRETRSRPAKE